MNKYIVLVFILFLISYSYMMMGSSEFCNNPNINKDKKNNEVIIKYDTGKHSDDFEKTYYANNL